MCVCVSARVCVCRGFVYVCVCVNQSKFPLARSATVAALPLSCGRGEARIGRVTRGGCSTIEEDIELDLRPSYASQHNVDAMDERPWTRFLVRRPRLVLY